MRTFIARRSFRYGPKIHMAGDRVPVRPEDISTLIAQGRIGVECAIETIEPTETAANPEPSEVTDLGGGWYEVRGQKIRGREAAMEAAEGVEAVEVE